MQPEHLPGEDPSRYRRLPRDIESGTVGPGPLPPPVADRFAAQLAYVDRHAGDAVPRFERFRRSRVAVIGRDEVARWCALSLLRNGTASLASQVDDAGLTVEVAQLGAEGCPVEVARLDPAELPAYDVVVVTPEPAGPREVLRLLGAGLPAGMTLLPAWTLGRKVVVGPSTVAGSAGCWACAALRLSSAGDGASAAGLWASVALPAVPPGAAPPAVPPGAAPPAVPPGRALRGPLAAMVGNLLGYEVFRLRTGALPAETRRQVLVQDVASLEVTAQPVLPDPRCPFCAPLLPPAPTVDRTAVARWRPAAEPAEDDDRALAALAARSVLVQPDTGPFPRWADESWTQLPLKVGSVEVAVGPGSRRTISAVDLRHVAGARLRALRAAAAVYVEHVVPLCLVPEDERALDPGRLATASGTGAAVSAWVAAGSLCTGDTVLVPAAAVRPFGPHNAAGAVTASSAGCGAGGSATVAVVRGLLSALSWVALDRAVRRVCEVGLVEPESLTADPELAFLVKSAANLGVELELLELASPAPVLLARSVAGGPDAPRWVLGTDTEWRRAAVAALRDLLGQVQLAAEDAAVDTGDPVLADLDPATLVSTGGRRARLHSRLSVAGLLDRVRDSGWDALAVPAAATDLQAGGLHVARVLVDLGTADGS
ncbi:MAG: TOMM precursor leader peptide-binding protein [Mycobacteriales bacterium]